MKSVSKFRPSMILGVMFLPWTIAGCADPEQGPVVIFLDGAGWYASAGSVERGLKSGGYEGAFRTFSWSAFLGPAHDHLVTAKNKAIAKQLAERVERIRNNDPDGRVDLMGLSAGTAVVLSALEQLPDDVNVDNVVLMSSSVSANHDLTRALRRIKRNLYSTCSRRDAILSGLPFNADGQDGPPAGINGFRPPRKRSAETDRAYMRVINIPWSPAYLAFGWDGGHTAVTTSKFVSSVITPRIVEEAPFPLDRPVIRPRMSLTQYGPEDEP